MLADTGYWLALANPRDAWLRDGRILSSDERDFEIYRWGVREPFENLLPSFRTE